MVVSSTAGVTSFFGLALLGFAAAFGFAGSAFGFTGSAFGFTGSAHTVGTGGTGSGFIAVCALNAELELEEDLAAGGASEMLGVGKTAFGSGFTMVLKESIGIAPPCVMHTRVLTHA